MKHQRDIQYPVKQGTVYPFDVSYTYTVPCFSARSLECGFGVKLLQLQLHKLVNY